MNDTDHTLSTGQSEREASGAHPYGRYLEEFEVGAVYKHWPAKTVTEADDHLFCLITMNHHPLHINDVYASESQQGRNVVVGPLVYALALGMSVSDVSGKAIANLATEELSHPAPVFHGDTLYCESEVLDVRSLDLEARPRHRPGPYAGLQAGRDPGRRVRGGADPEAPRTAAIRRRPRPTSTSAGIFLARLPSPGEGRALAVKDLFDTAGLTTTYGSAVFRDHVPARTAEAVTRLETAGWANVGKANLHEFAYGITSQNPHFGDVRTPPPRSVAGGSSGGSAAAVAAGLAEGALGTDSGGSIRIPAAWCGVVGFKPSHGLVPMDGCFRWRRASTRPGRWRATSGSASSSPRHSCRASNPPGSTRSTSCESRSWATSTSIAPSGSRFLHP